MKNGLFCLALAGSFQCFSMQPEMTPVSDKNLTEQPLSCDEGELARQRLTEIEEEIIRNLSRPLSRPRPIPDPGINGFYEWTYRAFKSWVYTNLFRVSRADISKVLDIIYSNMYEALENVGTTAGPIVPCAIKFQNEVAYIDQIFLEQSALEGTFIPASPLPPDEINSLDDKYHKLAEDCLMTMIEQVGRSQDTQGGRYLLAALKRLFFLRFHPEMIGKEFRPGYLSPGDDPEVMCRGGYGTWCRREYD